MYTNTYSFYDFFDRPVIEELNRYDTFDVKVIGCDPSNCRPSITNEQVSESFVVPIDESISGSPFCKLHRLTLHLYLDSCTTKIEDRSDSIRRTFIESFGKKNNSVPVNSSPYGIGITSIHTSPKQPSVKFSLLDTFRPMNRFVASPRVFDFASNSSIITATRIVDSFISTVNTILVDFKPRNSSELIGELEVIFLNENSIDAENQSVEYPNNTTLDVQFSRLNTRRTHINHFHPNINSSHSQNQFKISELSRYNANLISPCIGSHESIKSEIN